MKTGKYHTHPHCVESVRDERRVRTFLGSDTVQRHTADQGRWNLPSGTNLAEFALHAGFLASFLWNDAAKHAAWLSPEERDSNEGRGSTPAALVAPVRES